MLNGVVGFFLKDTFGNVYLARFDSCVLYLKTMSVVDV